MTTPCDLMVVKVDCPSWIATTTKVSIPSRYPGDEHELTLNVEYDEEGRLESVEIGHLKTVDARHIKGLAEFLATIADRPIRLRPEWETKEKEANP